MKRGRPKRGSFPDWAYPVCLFLFFFFLNALLLSPFIGWYDEGEMVGATACLGISHPSGQAIYHLLGKIFLLLSFGSPTFRLGLLSSLCGALSLSIFYYLCLELAFCWGGFRSMDSIPLILRGSLALFSLAWGLSLPWWEVSRSVEVYSLHLFFGLGLLFLMALGVPFRWALIAFWLGIATIFRPTQCLALPFVAFFFLKEVIFGKREHFRPKTVLVPFTTFLLGRMTVLYLPLRSALDPPMAFTDLTHPLALLRHVLGLGFSRFVGTATFSTIFHTLGSILERMWRDLTPLGLLLSLAGIWMLFRKPRQVPSFLWVGLLWGAMEAGLVLAIPYPTFEPHQMLLGWAASGLLAVGPLVWAARKIMAKGSKTWILWSLLGLWVGVQFLSLGSILKERGRMDAEDYARNVLEMMGPSALYIPAEENEYFPVIGLQQSEGVRKDIGIVMPGTRLEDLGPRVAKALEQGRPVFVTRRWEGLPEGFHYRKKGPLLEVTKEKVWEKVPTPKEKPIASWGGLHLWGVTLDPGEGVQGGRIEISYDWSKGGSSPQEKSAWMTVLFTDAEGNYLTRNGEICLHDIHPPFGGELAFSSMEPDQVHREKEVLLIPSDFPPGEYRVMGALQRAEAPLKEARKTPAGSFYEEAGRQTLEKFSGRVEGNNLIQFTPSSAGGEEALFWPVTDSTLRPVGKYFVPLVKLRIRARED